MSQGKRAVIFVPLVMCLVLSRGKAGTITLQVNCGSTANSSSTLGDVSCTGFLTPPPRDPFAMAGATASGLTAQVMAGGTDSGQSTATYMVTFDVTITDAGESGLGYLAPCLTSTTAQVGGSASATFGSDSSSGTGNCITVTGGAGNGIPFTFGVPQIEQLSLSASETAPFSSGGTGVASLNGFMVFDETGATLSGAVVTLVDTSVPEPGSLAPIGVLFALRCASTYRCRRARR